MSSNNIDVIKHAVERCKHDRELLDRFDAHIRYINSELHHYSLSVSVNMKGEESRRSIDDLFGGKQD